MTNGLYRQPQNLNVNTWHARGGLSGVGQPATIAYGVDEQGNLYPLVYGNDQYGNPTLVTEDSSMPWQGQIIQAGIQAVSNIFGARSYPGSYPGAYGGYSPAAPGYATGYAAGGPNPNTLAAGLGISTQTLWLIGIGVAILLFGKGRR